jgi:hypothetical protein
MTHYEILSDRYDYAVEVLIDEDFDEFIDDELSPRQADALAID